MIVISVRQDLKNKTKKPPFIFKNVNLPTQSKVQQIRGSRARARNYGTSFLLENLQIHLLLIHSKLSQIFLFILLCSSKKKTHWITEIIFQSFDHIFWINCRKILYQVQFIVIFPLSCLILEFGLKMSNWKKL